MKNLVRPDSLPGLALVAAALLGMLCANSSLAELYRGLLAVPFEVRLGEAGLAKPLLLWINDGLMAVFFLLVALELKREVLDGELSRPGQVTLPLVAAIGGIVVPSAIYAGVNAGDPEALRGWAIPAATDIAFALGVLSMLGDRVPKSLKTFLLSLAVFDDLAAILIIAAFYTDEINWGAKGLALAAIAVLYLMNRRGVTRTAPYVLVGAFLWVCVLKSGVHATLAGVAVGLAVPLRRLDSHGRSPLRELEHALHPWVAFAIVPVFAFANAGVPLVGFTRNLLDPVALGILGGLVLGKVGGILATTGLMVKAGWAALPEGATWRSMVGVGLLAGVGFTMSLFIGTLAFAHAEEAYAAPLRIGVLAGSLLSAGLGAWILRSPAAAERPLAQ